MPVRPLRLTTVVPALCALAAFVGHCDEPRALVTLRAEASAAGADVMLSEVAELRASPETLERLARVSLSSSPPAGTSRVIETGYISLRLRRAGFGSGQVEVRGERVTVRRAGGSPAVTARAEATQTSVGSAQPPLVRRGELVEVVAECGAVTIRAPATADRDAALGELVALRLRDSGRTIVGRIVGPGKASLIITENPS